MRHSLPLATQFYVTAPQPCPYLKGRTERKLFTALHGDHAVALNDALSAQGFRRSQNVLYRPSCADCQACMSVRIRVSDFQPTKSQQKILRRNKDIHRTSSAPWATEPQFELFKKYLSARHADGGMADMDVFEFAAMVEETPIRSRVVEYYSSAERRSEHLLAVCLTDILHDGVSMVYSFFDPDFDRLSLGTFMILDHIEIARQAGLNYVYLGYWVPGSPKMAYKAKFSPLEVFKNNTWSEMIDPKSVSSGNHPLGTQPIPEQVANIRLPDVGPPPRGTKKKRDDV
ncbi:MAG: arginyltransferase [Pseudomonadota bacterium]